MSEKDLYSEVKARKMAALGKKDVVKAVEKHGKILAIRGKYEKPDKIIKHIYASQKEIINPKVAHKKDLKKYDLVFVGCPGNDIFKSGLSNFREYVMDGGWILTTDWCIRTIIETVFPGYIRWAGEKTADAVVQCEMVDPHHPFLDGVQSEITTGKYSKGSKGNKGKATPTFSWWLEDKSFPITIDRPESVHVLIKSNELGQKWRKDPVLVYFDVGKKGGKVIHLISHTHLQKGGKKGKFVSAMILTNILDEKISIKYGVKRGGSNTGYKDYGGTSSQPSIDWGASPQQSSDMSGDYVTPDLSAGTGTGLVGTAKVVETDESQPSTQKCALGDGNFEGFSGKIFKCSSCGAVYHENCINMQLQQNGICKICEKIFLF